MANYFNLILDTIAPVSPKLVLGSGTPYISTQLVDAKISTSDSTTSNYTMKLWGDLDLAQAKADGLVSSSASSVDEASAQFISFEATKQLKLSSGDGLKVVNLILRDDVYNVSSKVSSQITLDSTAPVVTISGPDVNKISKQSGKNICNFSFSVDTEIVEYKVKVVSSAGSAENTGTTIGTTNGSTNMSGTRVAAKETVNCTIYGADLEEASASDGTKVVKVFVKDSAGNWSI